MAVDGALTTVALVLKRFDFGETSQTAHLLTRDGGRLSVLAKGIKRGGADLRGPMDLFALAEVAIRRHRKGDLHLLVRYRVVTGFPGLRRCLERLWAAFYVAEVLHDGTREDDPARELFDLAVAALSALEIAPPDAVPLVVAHFELHFLARAGFLPRFDACVRCSKRAPENGPVRCSIARGGLVCRSCAVGRPMPLVLLRTSTRALLRRLLGEREPSEAARFEASGEDRAILRHLLPATLENVLERELRAAAFLPA